MKEEIFQLITLSDWIEKAINDPLTPKQDYQQFNGMKLLINRKISSLVLSSEFKEYIGFDKVDEVVKEVSQQTNMKLRFK